MHARLSHCRYTEQLLTHTTQCSTVRQGRGTNGRESSRKIGEERRIDGVATRTRRRCLDVTRQWSKVL